jgi:glycine/D-amino acid oxidase-like deaminating enzyme
MRSYWERQSFQHYDAAVIGAGISGLSTAVSLKEHRPSLRVVVLERDVVPSGASTRNAGFACIGSFTEMLADLDSLGPDKMRELVDMRRTGLLRLRRRLADDATGYRENGSYELIAEKDMPLLQRMDELNKLLRPVLGDDAFSRDGGSRSFGFDRTSVSALVQNHFEGELDSGKMMRSLWLKAMGLGIEIRTGCVVRSLEDTPSAVRLDILGVTGELELTAGQVAVCTNGFTQSLIPVPDLKPGRGQVLLTAAVAGLPFRGIFHFDQGYYYFREIAGRVLFGGGRNLDFEGETTTEAALNTRIQKDLEEKLTTIILPGRSPEIAQRWSGIMAFGVEKYPWIQRYSGRICLGVRLGGMGIAIGSELGERLARLVLDLHHR